MNLYEMARQLVQAAVPKRLRDEIRRFVSLEPPARWVYARRFVQRATTRTAAADKLPVVAPVDVLFVCHGNIMRSALAEALLVTRAQRVQGAAIRVRSAGTHATPGRTADPRMQKAAGALGISLEQHRATRLSRDLVEDSDIVFVMDHLNEASVLARFPGVGAKVRLLGTYSPSTHEGIEIRDPFVGDDAQASECAVRVAACVDAFLATVRGSTAAGYSHSV